MIVVDTSAVVAALAGLPPAARLVDRLSGDGDLAAPHLLDVELVHALRTLVSARSLTPERAADIRTDFDQLALTRYPHRPLADRMWELRGRLTAYDAAFVALAEALDVPLVTCDARMGRAGGHSATVEVYNRR